MESIRKQASKLRDQVAKQQQAVLKQFGSGAYGGSGLDGVVSVSDGVEHRKQQELERLFVSTRSGKHFQRDIARCVEGYIATGSKQVDIGTKLAEDCKKYGSDSTCTSGSILESSALSFARAHDQIEKERANLLKSLGTQVAEPLKAMVTGAPLEEARILAQRYDKMHQDTESQAMEVFKRQVKMREHPGNAENTMKLEGAEVKLGELKSNLGKLGKEATASMSAVEAQQQRLTLHRLIAMVEAELIYHQRVLQILEQLEDKMISEREQRQPSSKINSMLIGKSYDDSNQLYASHSSSHGSAEKKTAYFLGEVMRPYEAECEGELNLVVGDFVVIRKVTSNGWAEGECKGRAGWFPFGHVERRERVLASKMAEVF